MTATVAASALEARAERLRAAADARGLQAVIATNDASIAYLTGFHGLQLERLFAVVVRTGGGGALVVPALESEAADAAPTELDRVIYTASSDGLQELIDALAGARIVGVEESHLNLERARALEERGLRLEKAAELVMRLRERKRDDEVKRLRAAAETVGEVLDALFLELRPGDVEREVNARVEYRLKERGATECHPLVLFGSNGANPHGKPGERRLEPGDVVCADVSAALGGYWGDLTRCGTVGPPSEWARSAHAVVLEAQQAAIEAARPGTPARDVDTAQRRIVEASPQLGKCLHGAGHAIGMEVHEPPFLVPRTESPLAPGMVLTIEPGLYQPGTGGIRLEDDVLVTDGEPALLSRLPLELREIALR